jgi:bifunctional non-homologous end joining protein LigD
VAEARKSARRPSSAARGKDPLAVYKAKRDFAKTAEPEGEVGPRGGYGFIVQKHDATRLHYDFRLELDGVLKSWAVTRGPSLDPDDKRLAVRTEDHPLSYATFEGTIPKGEYGGGTVMLWDKGRWIPTPGKDPHKTLDEGHLHFSLQGERMKGEWILIRLKPRPGDRTENWLLRKVDDEYSGSSTGLTDKYLTSVKTGRTMQQIAEGK